MNKNTLVQEKIQQIKLLAFKKELEETRSYKHYLSIVTILKDEALYIKEWLDYHISIGVDHFYIYDDKSMDNIKEILLPYIDNKQVTYVFCRGNFENNFLYTNVLTEFAKDTRWLAFVDTDEFICLTEKNSENISLANFMKNYENYPALAISRLCFDSNNHTKVPEGSVLENYTRIQQDYKNSKENQSIKSIIDPLWIENIDMATHEHIYKLNQHAFKEDIDKIRINYYKGKLKKDWNNKFTGKAFTFTEPTTQDILIQKYLVKEDSSLINKKNKELEEEIKTFKQEIKEIQKNCKYYLSVVAILKNEAPYIKEWLDYYISIGIEHFYLYDNESIDNIKEILQPYIEKNYVTYSYWEGKIQQRPAYRDMMSKHAHESHWLAVIDLDEFICLTENISLADFMRNYEDYPALSINWLCFDSNNHITKPEGSVLENYTKCQDFTRIQNELIDYKSIVNPLWVQKIDLHSHIYKFNQYAVDENFNKTNVMGCVTEFVGDKIRINHYVSKSKEEYYAKVARGRADLEEKYTIKEESYNFPITTHDYTILQHIKK